MTSLYRHFDAFGKLLYVGISLSVAARLSQHRKSRWMNQIATVTVQQFPTREKAKDAERAAIKNENPEFNIRGKIAPAARRKRNKPTKEMVAFRLRGDVRALLETITQRIGFTKTQVVEECILKHRRFLS